MKIRFNIFLCFLLSSCASITTGANQSINVSTAPHQGATCNLSNDKEAWLISSTPGSASVSRSYSDLNIVCRKDVKVGSIIVKSQTKAIAWGNILAGGIIGGAVDISTGSAYDYPSSIYLSLE